jgi:hypothetical protein
VRDVALDPATGDLLLESGRARLTAPGAESVAQRLRLRLALWRGEYPLDETVGIPYAQLLGRKGDAPATLEAILRQAAASCPGVTALTSFQLSVGPDRAATISLTATATDGQPVVLDDFRVA